jgi:ribosomal protein L11 methyltransferase
LFDASVDIAVIRRALVAAFGDPLSSRLQLESLPDRDWERVWLDDFHPMQFGERLWVCPAGQRPQNSEHAVIIDLDPGLAFGTGTHATTALCLQWLDSNPPVGLQVLDFGCGSGILAIAALKLGASRVQAADIDEQALLATRDNALRNGVDRNLYTCLPEQLPLGTFDLVLANILANPLMQLSKTLVQRVRPGGDLVLSGILADQASEVGACYRPWFSLSEPVELDGWVRLHGIRRQAVLEGQ